MHVNRACVARMAVQAESLGANAKAEKSAGLAEGAMHECRRGMRFSWSELLEAWTAAVTMGVLHLSATGLDV